MRTTRRLLAALGASAVLATALTASAAATDQTATNCAAFAVLKPGNEVRPPDTTDPVESRAAGVALVRIDGTKLRFSVVIGNPARETFVAGHIHTGAAGTNGGVLVPLFSGSSSTRFFAQADALEISADTAAAICGDLGGHYVNYHTTQDPQGAIRGQLRWQ
jgi:CHRD domain